jgi:hypothetical protein
MLPFAIAATFILCAILGVIRFYTPADRWRATQSSGMAIVPHSILRTGDIVRTERGSVRLQSPAVGTIDLGANTTVRLLENRSRRHRLALTAGTIHAKTTSQPGVFVIDTPKARAVDLGCEYTLTIAPGGGGELHVIAGWVDLTHGYETQGYAQSLVPQGASAVIAPDGALGVPVFDDAAPAFHQAIRNHDVRGIVAHARTRDAFTLLNFFRLASPDGCGILYDRLNQLVPAPASITRESVRDWTPSSTELWWTPVLRASGIHALKKPKGALSGL